MLPVMSLFDFTGEAVRPWAEAGHRCYILDRQHEHDLIGASFAAEKVGAGWIVRVKWDADHRLAVAHALACCPEGVAAFVMGFPPCDDLAGCGAKHWQRKAQVNPRFQMDATDRAKIVEKVARRLSAPFLVENPSGALRRLWRDWDHTFHPFQYGGYIPYGERRHPRWPEYIPDRDGYKKLTCLWTSEGFVMPEPKPVIPEIIRGKATGSRQFAKLGGKSLKTKNIRSASPRGFFAALYLTNKDKKIASVDDQP